jgi:hypothetical protein
MRVKDATEKNEKRMKEATESRGDSFPSWSLATFQPLSVEETMNAEMLSESSILFLISAVLLGALAWFLHRRRPDASAQWFWPSSTKKNAYASVALINVVLSAVLWTFITMNASIWLLWAAIGMPLVATGLTAGLVSDVGSGDGHGSGPLSSAILKWSRSIAQVLEWETWYLIAGTTLLFVTAVLPAVAFFKLSYNFERDLLSRREQRLMGDRVVERQSRLTEDYVDVVGRESIGDRFREDLHSTSEISWKYAPQSSFGSMQIGSMGSNIYQQEELSSRVSSLEWLLRRVRPTYNGISEQMTVTSNDEMRPKFAFADAGGQATLISTEFGAPLESRWRSWTAGATDNGWRGVLLWWGGCAVWVAALYGIVAAASRSWRLNRLCGEPLDASAPRICRSKRRLIIAPELSTDRTDLVNRLPKEQVIDVRQLTRRVRRQLDPDGAGAGARGNGPKQAIADDSLAGLGTTLLDMPDWRTKLPKDPAQPIVLDHFEYRIDEPDWVRQKLELVEQLAYRYDRSIIVLSSVDPVGIIDRVDRLRQHVSEGTRLRWVDVFGTFECRGWLHSDSNDVGSSIDGQYPQHQTEKPSDVQTLQTESQIQAEPYYRGLWKSCTKEEQLALIQLAEEGLLNPKCSDVAATLVARGLIVCDGAPHLMNDTFRRFVVHAVSRETVAQWELDERVPWDNVLIVGVVGLTAFLFFTQQDLAKNWVAYLGAMAAAVPALFKALTAIRSMSSEA